MTEVRGGLRYSIEVEDQFTQPLERFRLELAKTKEAARSGRVKATQARQSRSSSDPEGTARNQNATALVKTQRSVTQELVQQGRLSRLATTRAKQETAELRKQEVAERKKGAEDKRNSERRIQSAKEVADLEKTRLRREEQSVKQRQSLERESLKTKREAVGLEKSRQQQRQSELRADREGTKALIQEDERSSKQRIANSRELTAEQRRAGVEQANLSKQRLADVREVGKVNANADARRAAADVRSVRRAREATEQERRRTQAQKTALNERRKETAELNRQRAKLLLINAQERGRITLARKLQSALRRVNAVSGQLLGNLIAGAGRLLGFTVIFSALAAGAAAIRAAGAAFLSFNVQVEKAQLGIAALLTAVGTVSSAIDGNVKGAQALVLAQTESVRQTALLRKEGLQTAATFEQLLDTFQQALGPGLQAGLDVDQIRKFSVRISQAASAIGVPQNQLAEEIRSLLAGTINPRTTRIATSLGITNEDIRRAKEAGDLIGLLTKRFSAFDAAGKASLNTYEALTTNVQDALGQLLGTAGTDLFATLKDSLREIFDFVTEKDPITGALLPDPELVAVLEPLFQGLAKGIEGFREQIQGIQGSDFEETLVVIGEGLEQIGVFAGILTRALTQVGSSFRDLKALVGSAISNPFGRPEEIIKQARAFRQAEKEAAKRARSARVEARETAAFAAQVRGLGGATVTSNSALAQTQVTLDALAKAREKATAALSSGGAKTGKVELLVNKELARLEKERISTLKQLARAAASYQETVFRSRGLAGAGDAELVDRVVRNAVARQEASQRASQASEDLAAAEARQQAARERFQTKEVAFLEHVKQTAKDQLADAEDTVAFRTKSTKDLLKDKSNRNEILSLANQQLTAQTQILASQQKGLEIAKAKISIEKAAAQLASSQAGAKAQNAGAAIDKELLADQKKLTAIQDKLAEKRLRAAGASEVDLINAREKVAIERRDLALQERKATLLDASSALEARAAFLQKEAAELPKAEEANKKALIDQAKELVSLAEKRRTQAQAIASFDKDQAAANAQRTAFLQEANASTEDALRTLNQLSTLTPEKQAEAVEAVRESASAAEEWRDATYEVRDSSDAITQSLVEQAKLERAAARSAKDRAEADRLRGELTQNTKGNTGGVSSGGATSKGASGASSSANGPAGFPGFSAVNQQGFQSQADSFDQAGQALGAILTDALTLTDQEQAEVAGSYDSLFGQITARAQIAARKLFSLAGAFKLVGAFIPPVGLAGSFAGFAKGGLVGPNARGAQPSLAHYANPRGFASGGSPPGLHPSDNIPVWVGAGEYIQPTNAVRHYGTQFMEAVRRLEIDPFQARALAKGVRPRAFQPKTGGFATGGQVTPGASSQQQQAAGPAMAFIVSSPDQMSNLLEGGAGALEDYVGRNAGEFRSKLGL